MPRANDRALRIEDVLDRPLREVLQIFHRRVVYDTTYFGISTRKNPLDFWVYQELIHRLKPDYVIEIGTFYGGSALALAHLLEKEGKGKVITVDIMTYTVPRSVKEHPQIDVIEGDATKDDVFEQVRSLVQDHHGYTTTRSRVMVIEDSAHTKQNTLAVLRRYSTLLGVGDYFVIEDSILGHGLPDATDKLGPLAAIEEFLEEHTNFAADRSLESFLLTFNPKGYLKKIAD